MRSAYKPLLLLAVVICLCSACTHEEQGRTMVAARSSGEGEVASALLQPPTGLRVRIVPEGFLLSWSPSPQDPGVVTGYEIVRASVFSGPYETVGTVNKGVSTFVDKTAKPEIIYFYKVRAIAGSEYSPFSGEASGEMPGKP
jgi:hypothetical protein